MSGPSALMIFAAGRGTRMGALTQDRPKPLVRVAGRPLLDHALELGQKAGAAPIVVNTHYLGAQIETHLQGRNIAISAETETLLDTGGGLRAALPLLGPGPVMTLNSDAVWRGPNPLDLLRAAWRPDEMDALLLCIPPSRAHAHDSAGDFTLSDDGLLTRGPGLTYTGAQIINPARLHEIGDEVFSLNRLWDLLTPRLHGLSYPGDWCDVGHPAGIAAAEAMLERADG